MRNKEDGAAQGTNPVMVPIVAMPRASLDAVPHSIIESDPPEVRAILRRRLFVAACVAAQPIAAVLFLIFEGVHAELELFDSRAEMHSRQLITTAHVEHVQALSRFPKILGPGADLPAHENPAVLRHDCIVPCGVLTCGNPLLVAHQGLLVRDHLVLGVAHPTVENGGRESGHDHDDEGEEDRPLETPIDHALQALGMRASPTCRSSPSMRAGIEGWFSA